MVDLFIAGMVGALIGSFITIIYLCEKDHRDGDKK